MRGSSTKVLKFWTPFCFSLLLCLLAGLFFAAGAAVAFSEEESCLLVESGGAFREFPLTVEARVRLDGAQSFNIVLAHEMKSSASHWELFTTPKDGYFCLYVPGFSPDHLRSQCPITDGIPHKIGAILEKDQLTLFVDGKEVAKTPAQSPKRTGSPSFLAIGQLVEGGLGCAGEVFEVRITQGIRKIEADENSSAPFSKEKNTIGLWNFAAEPGEEPLKIHPDLSGNDRNAMRKIPTAQGIIESSNITAPFLPLPDPPEMKPVRSQVMQRARQWNLQSVLSHPVRDAVWWEWNRDFENWNKIEYADRRPIWSENRSKIAEQVFDSHALVWSEDCGPTGTLLRRTRALLEHLNRENPGGSEKLKNLATELDRLEKEFQQRNLPPDSPEQKVFYMLGCILRREIAFENPLLDFEEILCLVRGTYAGSIRSNPHTMDMQGGHFVNQYFGFNALPGGGLFIVRNWKSGETPEVRNLLEDSVVQKGPMQGKKLDFGAFCTPDLDFDGRRISFSWCGNSDHRLLFSRDRLWNVFTVNRDGSGLTQLTEGPFDDFDSCWLPDGRLAFISERRGGYIRCFSGLTVPQFSLFSMKSDGTDLFPLSYYETSEWNPTVNHEGRIVYTRWDYTDRENCLGSRFWICGPDGSNPRAPHGNYPYPWDTFPDNPDRSDSRMGAPRTETGIRAVPNSPLYIFTAAPHHGDIDGSLCMLDLRIPDDGHMSQIKRITPEELFPESEFSTRSHFKYKTPWPLSEDFYLCNSWENLVLLDRFGNKELICDLREIPCRPDDRFRVFEPIPLRARPRPPALPSQTARGKERGSGSLTDSETPQYQKATISVMNVYESDQPFPEGVKIKWIRIVQNILKRNPEMGDPMVGYERENTPRIPLGIVPVEDDGSAYFEAPIAKELIFQVLDENYMAVQSMRSVAYVHPGEQLSCIGCHEKTTHAPYRPPASPKAFRREPSKIQPEIGPIEPVSYYRQIRPIIEKYCAGCHENEQQGPQDMSYEALKEEYTFWFAGGMLGTVNTEYSGVHGGTRSVPGRFGARYCKIGQAMLTERHREALPESVRRTVNLWLDCNSLRLTAHHRVGEQLQGALVWPYLDVDPRNPLGVEGTFPELQKNFWHENLEGPPPLLCSSLRDDRVCLLDTSGKVFWEYAFEQPQEIGMRENGNILIAGRSRIREIEPAPDSISSKIIREFRIPQGEIAGMQLLDDGGILLGVQGDSHLVQYDEKGNITREIRWKNLSDTKISGKTRNLQIGSPRKTFQGTYLVPFSGEGIVREFDAEGNPLREFPRLQSPLVLAVRLPDGNTLIGGKGRIREYDPSGRVVWDLEPRDLPDLSLGVFSGFQRLPNGNTIVCNEDPPEGEGKDRPWIFEISFDKRVLWSHSQDRSGRIDSFQKLNPQYKPTDDPPWK